MMVVVTRWATGEEAWAHVQPNSWFLELLLSHVLAANVCRIGSWSSHEGLHDQPYCVKMILLTP